MDDDDEREMEWKSSLPPNLQRTMLTGPISPPHPYPSPGWSQRGYTSGPPPPPLRLPPGSHDSGPTLSTPFPSSRDEQHFQPRGHRRTTTTAIERGDPPSSSSRSTPTTSSLSHGDVRMFSSDTETRGDSRHPHPPHAYPPPYRETPPRTLFEGRTLPPLRPSSDRGGGITRSLAYGTPPPPPPLVGLEPPYEHGRTPGSSRMRTESAGSSYERHGDPALEARPRPVIHRTASAEAGPSRLRAESHDYGEPCRRNCCLVRYFTLTCY
jgi:hypothetical protein